MNNENTPRTRENFEHEWLTLNEASNLTGKSRAALRMMLKRRTKKGERVRAKKEDGRYGKHWVIHISELYPEIEHVHASVDSKHKSDEPLNESKLIPFDYYDKSRSEWENDKLELVRGYEQAVMMYRFKFEEAEKKLKMLPAPVEVVIHELEEKDEKLRERESAILEIQAEKKRLKDASLRAQEAAEAIRTRMEDLESQIEQKKAVERLLREEKDRIQKEKAEAEEAARREKESMEAEAKTLKAELEAERNKPFWKKIFGVK